MCYASVTLSSLVSNTEEPLKRRQSSPAPPSPHRRSSPSNTCKTNLMGRLESSDIGPLSPTRRTPNRGSRIGPGRPSHRSSTYTVVSDINRTLPQQITPLPTVSGSIASQESERRSSTTATAAFSPSPRNPFLNLQPSGPAPLASVPSVALQNPPIKPVLCDAGLNRITAKCAETQTEERKPAAKLKPPTSPVAILPPSSNSDAGVVVSKTESALVVGSSGALSTSSSLQAITPAKLGDKKNEVNFAKADFTETNERTANTPTEEPSPDCSLATGASSPTAPSPASAKKSIGTAPCAISIAMTPKTINLLEYARKAVAAEEKPPETSPPEAADSSSGLWWKKSQPGVQQRDKRTDPKSDPAFVPDDKKVLLWRRSPGGSVASLEVRLTRRASIAEAANNANKSQTKLETSTDEKVSPKRGTLRTRGCQSAENNAKRPPSSASGSDAERRDAAVETVRVTRSSSSRKVDQSEAKKDDDRATPTTRSLGKGRFSSPTKNRMTARCTVRKSISTRNSTLDKTASASNDQEECLGARRSLSRSRASPRPDGGRTTRSRSKSYDVANASRDNVTSTSPERAAKSRTSPRTRRASSPCERARSSTLRSGQQKTLEPVSRPQAVKNETAKSGPESDKSEKSDIVQRRYPKRDTYLCLKSFSGLSPNYALASYCRGQDKTPQKKGWRKPPLASKSPAKQREHKSLSTPTVVSEYSSSRKALRRNGTPVKLDEQPLADPRSCETSRDCSANAEGKTGDICATNAGVSFFLLRSFFSLPPALASKSGCVLIYYLCVWCLFLECAFTFQCMFVSQGIY